MSAELLQAMRAGHPLTGVDVVDAHAHLGTYSLFFVPDSDAAAMVGVMDRTGVRLAVLSSNRAIQHDAPKGNDETLRAIDRFPDRLAGYGVVNPWQRPEQELERIANDQRFLGVKVHPDLHEYPLTGDLYEPLWERAAAERIPVLTHTWHGSRFDDPAMVGEVLARHPGIPFLLGHSGVSPAGMAASIQVAQRHPTAYLEICGSGMTGSLLRWLVDRVGADRVLFGSDFPFIDQRCSLGRVVGAGFDSGTAAAILGGNARLLFGPRSPERFGTVQYAEGIA